MAASIYHAKKIQAWFSTDDGLTWTAFTALRSWSVALSVPTSDVTPIGDVNIGRLRLAGIPTGTATIECYYDSTNKIQVDESDNAGPDGIKIELSRDGTNASLGYAGNVLCTSVSVGVDGTSTETVTYNFTFTGPVIATITQGTI